MTGSTTRDPLSLEWGKCPAPYGAGHFPHSRDMGSLVVDPVMGLYTLIYNDFFDNH